MTKVVKFFCIKKAVGELDMQSDELSSLASFFEDLIV